MERVSWIHVLAAALTVVTTNAQTEPVGAGKTGARRDVAALSRVVLGERTIDSKAAIAGRVTRGEIIATTVTLATATKVSTTANANVTANATVVASAAKADVSMMVANRVVASTIVLVEAGAMVANATRAAGDASDAPIPEISAETVVTGAKIAFLPLTSATSVVARTPRNVETILAR